MNRMTKTFRILSIAAVFWLVGARAALACPVCFGASDSPLVHGSNLAILALLGVTAGVLGAFATFFLHLGKRAKVLATEKGVGSLFPEDADARKRLPIPFPAQEGNR